MKMAGISPAEENRRWMIVRALVETGAFQKYDLEYLKRHYGDWIAESKYGGPEVRKTVRKRS